ncbi:MAG: LEPR-XLL domain-containing protein, partial [Phycisphaerales bacterium]
MKRTKMQRDKRRSQQGRANGQAPVFERLEPRVLLSAVPYSQDFSGGKPGIAGGWEYYSDAEGRIEVVGGRLRLDDTAGNGTYSLNEAVL